MDITHAITKGTYLVEALADLGEYLAAGYLEPAEVGIAIETRASLHDVPLAHLADEVARRVSEN